MSDPHSGGQLVMVARRTDSPPGRTFPHGLRISPRSTPWEAARSGRVLAAHGHYTVAQARQFAGLVDDPDLEGIRASVKAGLQGDYDKAVQQLDNDADSIATKFDQGPTTSNVRELVRQGLIPLSAGVLYPGLELSAADKERHVRSLIEDGELTEERRQQILENNPRLLEDLTGIEDPNQQQQETIITLALPNVDGADGEADADTALEAVDGNAPPSDFVDAFGDAEDVTGGLALLAPWAARNGINLTGNARVGNARAYATGFLDRIAPRHRDVTSYIQANQHSWDTGQMQERPGPGGGEVPVTETVGGFTPSHQERLLGIYGDAILSVSNEEFGGGWDQLPEETQEAIHHDDGFLSGRPGADFRSIAEVLSHSSEGLPPGDRMAVELGNSVQHSLYNTYSPATRPGMEGGWSGAPGQEHLGGVLEVISRNHEATTSLLTGDTSHMSDHGELPGSYDRSEFIKNVYTQQWNDNGAAAASLTDWLDESFTSGNDSELARAAYTGLTETLTSTGDGGIFTTMLDTLGDGSMWGGAPGENTTASIGAVNPHLVRSLGLATEHEHILEEMATADGESDQGQHVRTMMLIGGDEQAAQRMAGAVTAYNSDTAWAYANGGGDADGNPMTAEGAGRRTGQLYGLLDAGLYNEAAERSQDGQVEADARAETINTGIGMFTGIIPDPSGATGAGGELLKTFNQSPNVEQQSPTYNTGYSVDGSHVEIAAYGSLVDRLHASGRISDTEYEGIHDSTYSGDQLGRYRNLLEENGIDPLDGVNDRYEGMGNQWVPRGADDPKGELADFIEHGHAPGGQGDPDGSGG